MFSLKDKAYFAGLFDGEGCITIKRTAPRGRQRTHTYIFSLSIEMADPRPIKAVCQAFNLNLTYNTSRHLKNPSKHRYMYVAQIGRQAGIKILKTLLPYLIAKREEAELAIEFYERCFPPHLINGRNRRPVPKKLLVLRHRYYAHLRQLKRRNFAVHRKQSF